MSTQGCGLGYLSPRYPLTDSCAPSLYIFGGGWETENALTQNKYCSSIAKVFVCYQHFVSSQMQTIGPHNFLWRKVTLFHPKPVHKYNPQRSRSGSIPFLNFLTLGIQKDVHSSTEILMGGIMCMQVSGFHFILCCEPRRTWENGVCSFRSKKLVIPAPTELLSDT